jgi:hypothetical protein
MKELDDLDWLTEWYLAQCDEDWEEEFGVTIDTLDNPGWSLTVDLDHTAFEGRKFAPIYEGVPDGEQQFQGGDGDTRWMVCRLEGPKFKAWGGPRDLGRMVRVFRTWIETEGGFR